MVEGQAASGGVVPRHIVTAGRIPIRPHPRPSYSHYSVKSVPVISTVDITGPNNAPQAPRERGMWTANRFMADLLNLFSDRINLHESERILEELLLEQAATELVVAGIHVDDVLAFLPREGANIQGCGSIIITR